ncbi:MAG TPA: MFS transporter, partial [Aggregatilineales bacterium]|nr:MFS transporter [Aggregatilineales bacterium]
MTALAATWRTLRANFSPLSYPNFRTYLGGQAISLIGTWLQVTAQAWVVWQLTQSESALGVVSMLNALPLLMFSLNAGVWVDRIDRRKLLIATQLASMVLAFILAALTQTGLVQVWHIYVLSFSLGLVNALDLPAQQTFLGDLTGMADVRKAVNLNVTIIQVSRILGPALAGLVVARIGVAPAFWLNGLSFLAVIASLIVVRAAQQVKPRANQGQFQQIAEAVKYLRTQPRLMDVFLFAILLTFFVFSIIMNILPAVASKLLGGDAATLGLLLSSSGAGALVSVVVIVPLVQTLKRSGIVMLAGLFWLAFWLTIFAHSRVIGLSMGSLFMGSLGAPTVMTMAMGLVQIMAPADMRGRLISFFTLISFGTQPVAALWIGQSAQILGVDNAIQINAILLALGAGLFLVLRPAVMRYEYAKGDAAAPPAMEILGTEGFGEIPDRMAERASVEEVA